MSKADVYRALTSTGIPSVHMAWPEGSAPALPWTCFYLEESTGFYADDTRHNSQQEWVAELYQKFSSPQLEQGLQAAITAAFGNFSKTETWVESECCLMTAYRFTDQNGD